jgi:hypothetical protein
MADILTFNALKNGRLPPPIFYFGKHFLDSLIMKKYDLRNNGINFQLDKHRTNFLKKSISYSGAKCWIAGIICQMRLRQKK